MHSNPQSNAGDAAIDTWLPATGYCPRYCMEARLARKSRGNISCHDRFPLGMIRTSGRKGTAQLRCGAPVGEASVDRMAATITRPIMQRSASTRSLYVAGAIKTPLMSVPNEIPFHAAVITIAATANVPPTTAPKMPRQGIGDLGLSCMAQANVTPMHSVAEMK
jgi:hypothetical protein